MKPPICYICKQRIELEKGGGLVQFKKTNSDIEKENRIKKHGFIGHFSALEWFCEFHFEIAKKYSYLTLSEAVMKIKLST